MKCAHITFNLQRLAFPWEEQKARPFYSSTEILKKKKKLPPLRAAEIRPAWLRQLAVASLTDASSAKWRHVNLCEVHNKSQLPTCGSCAPKSANEYKIQKTGAEWSTWCALCCRVSRLLWSLCCVSPAGLSDTRRPTCTPLCVEMGVGYSGPHGQPTGPLADLEILQQRSRRKQEVLSWP